MRILRSVSGMSGGGLATVGGDVAGNDAGGGMVGSIDGRTAVGACNGASPLAVVPAEAGDIVIAGIAIASPMGGEDMEDGGIVIASPAGGDDPMALVRSAAA